MLSDDHQHELDIRLAAYPWRGVVIRGTGGIRKLRVSIGGRGKRGGARVIYYYKETRERVYLIAVYPKNVKVALTGAEKKEMRKLTAMLEAEP